MFIPARSRAGAATVATWRRRVGAVGAEVALPVEVVCTLLGIDPGRLAAAVRARATRPDRARSSAHLRGEPRIKQ